jgi:hypothetical protein
MDNIQEVCHCNNNICFKGTFVIFILEKSKFPQYIKIHS